MRNVWILVVVLLLPSCITTSYREGDKVITYTDWFKKASKVHVTWGPVTIEVGDISSQLTAEDIATYLRVMAVVGTAPPVP